MSFIGLVTRKDKDTGVTLRAKVVTPSKKKSATQDFKVRVKRSGLSDYERCVMDQAAIREALTTQNFLSGINHDIHFINPGPNGCDIKYEICDVGTPLLSDYIDSSGKLIGRPKFGENAATGYIAITVSYGKESIQTRINITIAQYDGNDIILSDKVFSHEIIWNAIKGMNDAYAQNGHKSIQYQLNLIQTSNELPVSVKKEYTAMSSTPATFTWEVEDQYSNSVITQPRITVEGTKGNVFRPSYKDAVTLVGTSSDIKIVSVDSISKDRSVQMEGLILRCKVTLGTSSREIEFLCGTRSKWLTNQEVLDVLVDELNIAKELGGAYMYAKNLSDAVANTLSVPSGGVTTLGLPFSGTAENWSLAELGLNAGEVVLYAQHSIIEFQNEMVYPNDQTGNMLNMVSFDPSSPNFPIDTATFMEPRCALTIDGAKLAAVTNETLKQFTVKTTIKVIAYSKDGSQISSANSGMNSANLYSSFAVTSM